MALLNERKQVSYAIKPIASSLWRWRDHGAGDIAANWDSEVT
jgi:hypothetical protein